MMSDDETMQIHFHFIKEIINKMLPCGCALRRAAAFCSIVSTLKFIKKYSVNRQ